MALGRVIWTALVWNIKLSKPIIKGGSVPLKLSKLPMNNLDMYKIQIFKYRLLTPEEYFMNAYSEKLFQSGHVPTHTKRWRATLYDKCKN